MAYNPDKFVDDVNVGSGLKGTKKDVDMATENLKKKKAQDDFSSF